MIQPTHLVLWKDFGPKSSPQIPKNANFQDLEIFFQILFWQILIRKKKVHASRWTLKIFQWISVYNSQKTLKKAKIAI